MILQKLVLHGFGPFYEETTIYIEPEVTVLTGRNDTGKTFVLSAIKYLFTDDPVSESIRNVFRNFQTRREPNKDNEVSSIGSFTLTETGRRYLQNTGLIAGDEIDLRCLLLADIKNRTNIVNVRKDKNPNQAASPGKLGNRRPQILWLPSDKKGISSLIHPDTENSLERLLLRLAFLDGDPSQILMLHPAEMDGRIEEGENNLNDTFHNTYPELSSYSFTLRANADPQLGYIVNLKDEYSPRLPVEYRGSGVTKLLTFLLELMELNPNSGHIIILADEPENSFHADFQHIVRRVFESLARNKMIQVVYATHSPAMINTLKPNSIRLLELGTASDGDVTAKVVNTAFYKNFQTVRKSLGITPADSLLFAPVTLVVEGPTEVGFIHSLLMRLSEESVQGFENYQNYQHLLHFVDAEGVGNIKNICRIVESQGCYPIVFIDGVKESFRKGFEKDFPEIPIVTLKLDDEIEDLVPRSIYFKALSELNQDPNITEEAFDEWEKIPDGKPKGYQDKGFSKKVSYWLNTLLEAPISKKPLVMRETLKYIDDFSVLSLDKLREFVKHIEEKASNM